MIFTLNDICQHLEESGEENSSTVLWVLYMSLIKCILEIPEGDDDKQVVSITLHS